MRSYSILLAIAGAIGLSSATSATTASLIRRTDPIAVELGPLLSRGASIILPSDASLFQNLTARYSEYFAPGITAVVKVATEADIPIVLKYGKSKNRKVLAQNAGHGWGNTLAAIQDGILIKIDGFDSVTIDDAKNTMTVGGGVSVGDVIPKLYAAKKETSTGTCNCVGFLGAGLGGGHGRFQGLYGLIADNLISARIVTANGQILTVSKSSNSDLYWGLKGAGHNFGIVTEATFKIYDQKNSGNHLNIDVVYAETSLEAIFTAINNFNQPAEASIYVLMVPGADLTPTVIFNFVYAGPEATGKALFESNFGKIATLVRTDTVIPWDQLNDQGAMNFFQISCAGGTRKNSYTSSLKSYNVADVRSVFNSYAAFIKANPTASGTVMIFETYPSQAVQAVDATLTAYPHREQRHVVLVGGGYTDASLDGVASAWGSSAAATLNSHSGFDKPAVYVNYAHGDEDWGAKYGYEQWRQLTLKLLKTKYDPNGTFNGFHPIPKV